MQVLEIEPKRKSKITIFLLNIEKCMSKLNEFRELMDYFKYKSVDFAIIDYEDENLKDFIDPQLSELLLNLKIPTFPIYIPHPTKNYFRKINNEKSNQIKELIHEYENLQNKNCKKGHDLQSRINLYIEQRKENLDFYNFKMKPQYIAETIIKRIENSNNDEIIIIHFGWENSFTEIMKILKEVDMNIDIFYLHYL